jgi:uncharacterized protein (DUF1499 family)
VPAAKSRRSLLWILVFPAGLAALWLFNASVPPPVPLGVRDGRLAPSPDRPNCVNSQDTDPEHAIEPLRYKGSKAEARRALLETMAGLPRVQLISDEGDYLHFTVKTLVCRFVDDVEFWLAPEPGVAHVRSASRVGGSDLGVNRKRVETIRQKLGW